MSPEIWFFFTPDGSAEITVLNRESAQQVARLMNSQQRQVWKVRKNRWPEAMIVADCTEIFNIQEGLPQLTGPETRIAQLIEGPAAQAAAPQPVAQQPVVQQPAAQQPVIQQPQAARATVVRNETRRQAQQPAKQIAHETTTSEEDLWSLPESAPVSAFADHREEQTALDEPAPTLDFRDVTLEGFSTKKEERTEIMSLAQAQPQIQQIPPAQTRAQVVRNAQATTTSTAAQNQTFKAAPVISAPAAQAQLQQQSFTTPIRSNNAQRTTTTGEFPEKRRWPRYEARLRVVVISGNRSFRSFTRNISRGGLLLEHVIPQELLERSCRVIIGSADLKENIEFDARLAGDPQNPRAVEFYEGKDFFVRKLDTWLEDLRKGPRAA